MQIRKQLRANSLVMGGHAHRACICEARFYISTENRKVFMPCRSGYHGQHARIRFKARAQSHGNATGQSKGGQGK